MRMCFTALREAPSSLQSKRSFDSTKAYRSAKVRLVAQSLLSSQLQILAAFYAPQFRNMDDREPLLRHENDSSIIDGRTIAGVGPGKDLVHEVSPEELSPELQQMKSDAVLNAQGHKAEMRRSFSLFATLGLGFRYANPSNAGTYRPILSADPNK